MYDLIAKAKGNVSKVSDSGRKLGYDEGYEVGKVSGNDYSLGFSEGKQAEYNATWDSGQQNGNLTACDNLFSGRFWNNDTFRPKYNMQPTGAYMMFRYNQYKGSLIELLKEQNVTLDFSKCTTANYCFSYSNFTEIGIVDLRGFSKSSKMAQTFAYNSKLKKIEKIYIKETTGYDAGFTGCTALEEVIFEGTIGVTGFNFSACTLLNKQSIESIINCLSTTTTGLTVSLSLTAVNNAFETAEGIADGSSSPEWTALSDTKTNWTISLI